MLTATVALDHCLCLWVLAIAAQVHPNEHPLEKILVHVSRQSHPSINPHCSPAPSLCLHLSDCLCFCLCVYVRVPARVHVPLEVED